jgi:hypothetical protein
MFLLPLVFIWSRDPMRYGLPTKLVAMAVFAFGAATLTIDALPRQFSVPANAAESWDTEAAEPIDDLRFDVSRPRMREGARLGSTVGKFSRAGRRWVFEFEGNPLTVSSLVDASQPKPVSEDKNHGETAPSRYRVLENLALQRVVEAIAQDPNDVRWTATGVITEFGRENWLLLSTVLRAPSVDDTALAP